MNDRIPTPEEQSPEFLRARAAMNDDANEIVEMLMKMVNIRAGHFEPAENLHYTQADTFLLDLVIEKLQERR